MTAPVWTRETIESPCVNICVIHSETRLCVGCARSIDEITSWSHLTPEARRTIMSDLATRTAVPKARRGGRAGRITPGV